MSQSSKPIPIAIPNELLAKIDFAASRMPHKSKQDVMRMAMEFGLLDLEAMNYDVEGHAWRAMKAAQEQSKGPIPFVQPPALDRVAEPSPAPMPPEDVHVTFTPDEAEIIEQAKRKRSLARKMSTAAARQSAPGKPGASSVS